MLAKTSVFGLEEKRSKFCMNEPGFKVLSISTHVCTNIANNPRRKIFTLHLDHAATCIICFYHLRALDLEMNKQVFWKCQEFIDYKEKWKCKKKNTSGEDRAAFWNGTGEYNTGTSAVRRNPKDDLSMTHQVNLLIGFTCTRYVTSFPRNVHTHL